MHKIAVRIALTELRRKRWQDTSLDALLDSEDAPPPPHLAADRAHGPEARAVQSDLLVRVRRILEKELTPKQRRALVLLAVQNLSIEEVAHQMKTNRNALYKLLHDARLRLKKHLLREGLTPHEVLEAFELK